MMTKCIFTFGVLVHDLEVVPLGMAFGVEIVLQPQIVLHVVHLDCSPKVSILKL